MREAALCGNRIEAAAMEGMASQQAPQGHEATAHHSMLGNCNRRIFGARGLKAAGAGREGMESRRDNALIKREQNACAGGSRDSE